MNPQLAEVQPDPFSSTRHETKVLFWRKVLLQCMMRQNIIMKAIDCNGKGAFDLCLEFIAEQVQSRISSTGEAEIPPLFVAITGVQGRELSDSVPFSCF